MKSRLIAPVITLLALLAACGNASQKVTLGTIQPPLREASSEDSPKKRMNLFDTWIRSAQMVADQSQDQNAAMLMSILQKHARIGFPVRDGYVVLKTAPDHRFDVMQLLHQDTNLSPTFAAVTQTRKLIATFETGWKSIVLADPEPYTPLWQGIILLHETKHAHQAMEPGWDPTSREASLRREIEAFQMMGAILQQLDPTYRKTIEHEKARLQQSMVAGSIPRGESADISALDASFGVAKTVKEQNIRRVQVWIEASLELLHDIHGDTAQSHQIAFMSHIYGR
jgi:hypothetical protein